MRMIYLSVFFALIILPFRSAAANSTEPMVYIDPPMVEAQVGQAFNVTIRVDNVTDLYAWQMIVYFQNDVVNVLDAFEGPFLKAAGVTFSFGPVVVNDWNSTHGKVMIGTTLSVDQGVTGSGILATIGFGCVEEGASFLEISKTAQYLDVFYSYLLNTNLEEIPFQTQGGYVRTAATAHNVAITGVTATPADVYAGQIVDIDVVTINLGTMTESFNVTVYYDSQIIGGEVLCNKSSGEVTTLHFTWDTSGVQQGIYVLKALASVVPGETVVWNNIHVESTVRVRESVCDLSVSIETPSHVVAGEPTLLRATVTNLGWNTPDSGIELQLLIDAYVVNRTTFTKLDRCEQQETVYTWIPAPGNFTVAAFAPAVTGEETIDNNIANRTVVVSPPEAPTIQVEPWRTQVRVGELVRVFVRVYNATNLSSWQVKLGYDPVVLDFRAIWLPEDHVFAAKLYETSLPAIGGDYVMFGAHLTDQQSGFRGSGTLCIIDFKAAAMHQSALQLQQADTYLLDSNSNQITTNIVNSGVEVSGDSIQIVGLVTSKTQVFSGWIIQVNVTVRNNGYIPRTFLVTTYFASEVKATQQVSDLFPGTETTLSFYMDTSALMPYVDYAIWAEAAIVIGETWATNNYYYWYPYRLTWGSPSVPVVTIRIVPDINGDKKVDVRDIVIAAVAFGTRPSSQRWNFLADLNQDNQVDIKDLVSIAKNFGKTYS